MSISQRARELTEHPRFHSLVVALIIFAGIIVGLQTSPAVVAEHGRLLHVIDWVVLVLFMVELAIRITAHGPRPWRFFLDPWNVFDFLIVAVCVLPLHAEFAAVLRLARVLRVLRLVTALPQLQILVNALLKSIPSMGYVALLLSLHFYVYAVVGVTFFGSHDAEHFGNLGRAALTLFQVVTLEGWVDVMAVQREALGSPVLPVLYFISFILLGTMIMLNLLIGVIVNGMDEAREETEDNARARHLAKMGAPTVQDDVVALQRQAQALTEALAALQRRIGK